MSERNPPCRFVDEDEFYRLVGTAGFSLPGRLAAAAVRRAKEAQQEQELLPESRDIGPLQCGDSPAPSKE